MLYHKHDANNVQYSKKVDSKKIINNVRQRANQEKRFTPEDYTIGLHLKSYNQEALKERNAKLQEAYKKKQAKEQQQKNLCNPYNH